MNFNGFSAQDFETFTIDGLEPRMHAIQERIQPKFRAIGETLAGDMSVMSGREMFVHIAKHARRKVNPPVDTWMAFCANKRGYKQVPHFQIGLFDDRLFMWLAFIYELPNKQAIAKAMLRQLNEVKQTLPGEFMLSFDHMKKDAVSAAELNKKELKSAIERFRDVKSAELLIGRQLSPQDAAVTDGAAFIETAVGVFQTLMPLYKLACDEKFRLN
ncbi:YktB family protein [Paenibacillus thalictri]|uniref:UPF0637 protein EYB31_15330 n=1 Tax=Paenibacillus thalictri TaxID=2527873 RepID=A0A4Q9DRI0_9BACL|nr:DUF1054 domain-containing protein [Paenibacillus thalictri]TBL78241.1 DUF1054 domain-containing protein [Paenibacillus thalictri]